jgi:hypothetical protein
VSLQDDPLGRGSPGGAQSYRVAFEESIARADERRIDRSREGSREFDPRARSIGQFVLSGSIIALMTYGVWASLGAFAGILAGVAFLVGGFLLWRLWR